MSTRAHGGATDRASLPSAPAKERARALTGMIRVVSLAETIRAVPRVDDIGTGLPSFIAAAKALALLGLGRRAPELSEQSTIAEVIRAAETVLDAWEQSPIPEAEWVPISDLFGDDLASLLSISPSSLIRYRSGERSTPDAVAARLHLITTIVADLSGSYNDFGIRRWFHRSRTALDGRAPDDILTGDWEPDDPDVVRVRDLAHSLLGPAFG